MTRHTTSARRMGPGYQGTHAPAILRGVRPRGSRLRASALRLRLVDHLLEAVEGAIAEALAVHEEGRGALHVRRAALGHLLVDLRLHLGRGEILLPARDVEADLSRVLLQLVVRELAVVLEHDVVHLPELPLLPRGDGGL